MKTTCFMMLLLMSFFLTSATSQPTLNQFMPDNDLYLEDGVHFLDTNITKSIFDKIIDIGEELYKPTAVKWKETLTIRHLWNDSTVNASAWRDGRGKTEIMMYGGLARRPEVMPLSFALVLCHELNHLYGGTPYIETRLKMSAEGQSDYAGAGYCLKAIADKLNDQTQIKPTTYMKSVCKNDNSCLRRLVGGQGLGTLLAKLSEEAAPQYETPDPTVVKKTELSYPATTQCRLDTFFNAIFNKTRPKCWFKS